MYIEKAVASESDIEDSEIPGAHRVFEQWLVGHNVESSSSSFDLRVIGLRAGGSTVPHEHREAQANLVLSGSCDAVTMDETINLKVGDLIFFGASEAHGFRNENAIPCRMLCIREVSGDAV